MLKTFKSFQLATDFYNQCESLKMARHLKDQLLRSSSSIALNLAEGSGKSSPKDQKRFYNIALGSLRESHAVLLLAGVQNKELLSLIDKLGGCVYRLCYPKRSST